MPRYYEDKPEGAACAGVKEDLGACLLESDCVLQSKRASTTHHSPLGALKTKGTSAEEGKSPRQCLKEGYCKALKYSFFECKRSMLDARSRFRGRKGY
ncbi:cytochrome c oxidase assembly factor 5 isoform X1 [Microcebus murinus]|uniref:cytochrome c oxidase assembly factor 5 isoform X1 n=1 Tax=Microcebus murinus TaxID=30608 RepID=UPI000642F2DB|nr:cytochrome c oxidase assembly factor 5 isoform X1 [Microcebus murinus]